jgi:rhodanese-related sulfurtransferase
LPRQVLDVRSPGEWQAGSLPGALWRDVPDLAVGVPVELRSAEPVWVVCTSGYRAKVLPQRPN